MVNVQIATAADGATAGEGKSYPLVLGAGQAIAGIEELIMEAAPGETVERPVQMARRFSRTKRSAVRPKPSASRSTK